MTRTTVCTCFKQRQFHGCMMDSCWLNPWMQSSQLERGDYNLPIIKFTLLECTAQWFLVYPNNCVIRTTI
jgi:hypothetical protein